MGLAILTEILIGLCQLTEQVNTGSPDQPNEKKRVSPPRRHHWHCQRPCHQSWRGTVSRRLQNPNHVLSSLIQRQGQRQYHLRSRVHNFSPPPKDARNSYPVVSIGK